MLGGVADQLVIDPELLDDLKTAVSEACNNVVMHAYGGEPGPMNVSLYVGSEAIRVIVRDSGVGIPPLLQIDDRSPGVGLPVIRALAVEAQFKRRPEGGTEVVMGFAGRRDGKALFNRPVGTSGPDDGWPDHASGAVAVSLSPVELLSGVLGRLARALAAHAATSASGPRIGCRLNASTRRLELTVGPFRAGSGAPFRADAPESAASRALRLSDQLTVERDGDGELLHVVLIDHRT